MLAAVTVSTAAATVQLTRFAAAAPHFLLLPPTKRGERSRLAAPPQPLDVPAPSSLSCAFLPSLPTSAASVCSCWRSNAKDASRAPVRRSLHLLLPAPRGIHLERLQPQPWRERQNLAGTGPRPRDFSPLCHYSWGTVAEAPTSGTPKSERFSPGSQVHCGRGASLRSLVGGP